GNWTSTWSNNGLPISAVKQAPRNAVMDVGLYNWAISVQPLGDGTNEVRWYMVEQNNKYWFGGTVIDTAGVTNKINGVCFGFNKDLEATQVNLYAVMVDLGDPIEIPEAPWEPFYVTQWGKTSLGTAWPVLNDSTYLDGDASIGDGAIPTNWSTIRGGFEDPVQATTKKAVIVSGQLEFVGGGCASAYTHLRYALTFQDSATLKYQYTDSAMWESPKKHYGWGFHPRTGNGTMSNGNGGAGVVWTIKDGNWTSTWSNNGLPISAVKQAPRNAVMDVGLYNWAISIQPLGDGTVEVRWYMIEQNNKYWFGGTVIDTAGVTTKVNGVCFGFNKDLEATQVNLYAVMVDMGDPIEVPEPPWEPFYLTDWGFSGGNLGGWDLTLGDFDGDVTIGGTAAPTGWSAVRGGFGDPYILTPEPNRALLVTGKIELVGGGFEDLGSLRYGVFYSDSAGTTKQDADLDSNWVWTGSDGYHSGYLFVPTSGMNITSWSGQPGSWGAIDNSTWWDINAAPNYPLGSSLQEPANAIAGPGTYDFAISVSPTQTGNSVKATLSKTDKSYYWEVSGITAVAATTDRFNCVAFAINNSTTTTMNLIEVQVDRGAHITTDVQVEEIRQLPTIYSLNQNYPNPFNPTTTIEFALPQRSEVTLVVYDALGRVVAELANGYLNAGYYEMNFDARNLASGVYFVRLKAGDFVSVKKAMLLK
ncbi:T9SS type A sorting domain-containing protein, partial [candidate division KSB1 bacterium]|nr:T9SS type A sorting domain-containing protein [candidate division KSB1 bacterium]